jgi:hypothetical protein
MLWGVYPFIVGALVVSRYLSWVEQKKLYQEL